MNEESEQERLNDQPGGAPDNGGGGDPLLDTMLRWHMQDQLGTQVGGARERFNHYIDQSKRAPLVANAPAKPRRAPMMSTWSKTMLGTAIAASLALFVAYHFMLTTGGDGRIRRPGESLNPGTAVVPTAISTETPVLTNSEWETIDQGVTQLEDGSAARRLLQRRRDNLRYYDKKKNAFVEYTVPREETVYVPLNKY